MATILNFKPQQRAELGRLKPLPAEIVFFPGVRYERWADQPPAASPRPQRDRMNLNDDR